MVLIDALDPLAGGLFPLGRRREPLRRSGRATAIMVTRVEPGQPITGIERLVRAVQCRARLFFDRAWFRSSGWILNGA